MFRAKSLFFALLLFVSACSTGRPRLTSVREVARAGGSPQISRVVDLGDLALPRGGEIATSGSDGRLVVGELMLVYGDDFGKQPALVLGGEPCEVVSHVTGGGVIVRVPAGVPGGKVKLELSTRRGRTQKALEIHRRGIAATGGKVRRFTLGSDGTPTLGAELALPKVKQLLLSQDGAIAFAVTGGKLVLQSLDMVGALRVVRSDDLPGKRLQTAAGSPAGRLAILTDSHLVIVDTRRSRVPALYKPLALPRALLDKKMGGAALSPDGRTLAVLLMESNQLLLFDVSDPTGLRKPEMLDLLPEAKLPRVRSAQFSRDGSTLWVSTGDTLASLEAGHQAPEVLVLKLTEGAVVGEPKRRALREGFVSVAPAVGAGEPTPAGTSIRKEVARSSLYLGAGSAALMSKKSSAAKGLVFRVRSGHEVATLAAGDWSPVAVAVAGRPQLLVALAARGAARELVLVTMPAWVAGAKPRVTVLGGAKLAAEQLFSRGLLALQP